MSNKKYVLITAAYNEGAFIEQTIKSVLSQTLLPLRWIIVSDDSKDSTDEIVLKYAKKVNFIKFYRIKKKGQHDFCAKVNAINNGFKKLKNLEYDFIGNLDADIVLPHNYYQRLIELIKDNINVGIASGTYIEKNKGKIKRFKIPCYHTPGSIQLFRRECYETIGGYPPINGGEDSAAGVIARMYSWKTMSFKEVEALHLRPLSTGKLRNVLCGKFRLGESDYNLGMHPNYATLKFFKQITQQPYLIGGIFLYCGYLNALLNRKERIVSKEFIDFFRREQMSNLRYEIREMLSFKRN